MYYYIWYCDYHTINTLSTLHYIYYTSTLYILHYNTLYILHYIYYTILYTTLQHYTTIFTYSGKTIQIRLNKFQSFKPLHVHHARTQNQQYFWFFYYLTRADFPHKSAFHGGKSILKIICFSTSLYRDWLS